MGPVVYRLIAPGRVERLVDGDVQLLAESADLTVQAAAREMLADAECKRLIKPRSERVLAALATAFARDVLPSEPNGATVGSEAILAWIDGAGLDVILAVMTASAAEPPPSGEGRPPGGRRRPPRSR